MIYGTGRDGLNLRHIHHKPCTHHPSYDPAPAAADDSELEKRRGNPEKPRPHLLCSIQKLCTRFWFQASRGKTAVDADGQNGKKLSLSHPPDLVNIKSYSHAVHVKAEIAIAAVGNHMAGITMEVCRLIESKTEGDHGKAGVAFLGGDLAQLVEKEYERVASIDLLAGFAFDSTFHPEMMGCEKMLTGRMLDGHIFRIVTRQMKHYRFVLQRSTI